MGSSHIFSPPLLPLLPRSQSQASDGGDRVLEIFPLRNVSKTQSLHFSRCFKSGAFTMKDRSKNRRPLQRGRISSEAIQTVQALKRLKKDENSLNRFFESSVRRLLKLDLIAVLRELQRQDEGILALQVFEGVRAEQWYKPQVSLYADMVEVLANNGLFEKVELLISYLKKENLEADAEGFNTLLRTLINYDMFLHSMECFHLMKVVGCEVEESTFRILINGFESKGKTELSGLVRQEAEKYFGEPLEFLEEKEETVLKNHHLWK